MRAIRASSLGLVLAAIGIAGCLQMPTRDGTVATVADSTITTQVKSKLAADGGVGTAAQIHVQTYKGVVQLSGTVDSDAQVQRAVELARAVDGVRAVDDSIVIR